jgi:hypothetical protein
MSFHLPGPTKGKIEHLIATYGAERISKRQEALHDIPESKALICVVDSVRYETATYCFSTVEMTLLDDSTDFRQRTWLMMDRRKAEELSKFRTAPRSAGKTLRRCYPVKLRLRNYSALSTVNEQNIFDAAGELITAQ